MEGKEQLPQLTSEYVSALSEAQMESMENVIDCLAEAQQNQAKSYNKEIEVRHEYQQGDLVCLYSPAVKKGHVKKLSSSWKGPYRVLRKKGDVNYLVKNVLKGAAITVHYKRLKPCYWHPVEQQQVGRTCKEKNGRPEMNEAIEDEECLPAPAVEIFGEEIWIVILPPELDNREHELLEEEPNIRLPVGLERNRIPPVWHRDYYIN